MDKFVIKNKSGTLLSLPIGRNHLKMNPNDEIDLCSITGMGVDELERHPQVVRNKAYNNIVILDKQVQSKIIDQKEITDLSSKIEKLLGIVSENKKESSITKEDLFDALKSISIVSDQKTEEAKNKENIVSNEDEIRQELLTRQVNLFKPESKNTGSFGKNTKDIEAEDFADLLGD